MWASCSQGQRQTLVFGAFDASLDVLLDHFDHAIRVAGPDHVGIGADWDGVSSMLALVIRIECQSQTGKAASYHAVERQ